MKGEPLSGVRGLVYVAVGVAAIGGLLFGYDTGVISGAILFTGLAPTVAWLKSLEQIEAHGRDGKGPREASSGNGQDVDATSTSPSSPKGAHGSA